MAEKALFPQDSRLYLGTTCNHLLVERSVLLGVYLIKECVKCLFLFYIFMLFEDFKKRHEQT